MEVADGSLSLAVALTAGVVAQSLARTLRIPGIVLLLAFGVILGKGGMGWVEPRALGEGLFAIVDFAVAVILFEGGLGLDLFRLRRVEAVVRRLITIGPLVTLLGATVAAIGFIGWPWHLAFLFGSLVVVTGPTVVTPLVRDIRLRPRIKTILEAEGLLIDPIGVILSVLVLEIVTTPALGTIASGFTTLLLRFAFGGIAGLAGGFLISWILRSRLLARHGYENIFTLASVVLVFHGCNAIVFHSGILAVTLVGAVVGNIRSSAVRDLREFKDQLTVLLVGLLFILLAADIHFEDLQHLGWGSAGVIASLVLIVRPLGVWLSTLRSNLTFQEKIFIAWISPRGIVAAAVASLTAAIMESKGMAGGAELRALVFLTIAFTVVFAGLSARPLAKRLKLRLPRRDRVAILGAHGLGLILGDALRKGGRSVVFLDSDPKLCRQVEEAGFQVVFGNPLEERTFLRAQIELVGTVLGITSNNHLNLTFISQAKKLFKVPNGYIALDELEGIETPEYVRHQEGKVLFDGPHDTKRWDVRYRHKTLTIETLSFLSSKQSDDTTDQTKRKQLNEGDHYVILAIQRGERVFPMRIDTLAQNDDLATVAIFKTKRKQAIRSLHALGWHLDTEQVCSIKSRIDSL